ncbi:MAG: sugar transferase [Anaerolineae bacterium]|nr:sugar transferase [Anaerolineae bacterium]MCO5189699.1 sugar transferase [Anaerolineae bacterium]MCO5192732.1 sugar transferase [Anaerolineae bacterium]MCO5199822.1 sugar transferase [Anaerolineae bacterium]
MINRRSRRAIRTLTIVTDIMLFNIAFLMAYLARYEWQWLSEVEPQNFVPYANYLSQQLLLTLILALTFSQSGVWRRRRGEFWIDEVARIGYATAAGFVLMMAYTFFFRPLAVSRLMLFWAALFTIVLVALARLARRLLLQMAYRRGIATDRVLVIGSGEVGRGLIRTLLARPDLGYETIGYLHDGQSENNIGLGRIPQLGTWEKLPQLLENRPKLHSIFIALPGERHRDITHLITICQQFGVRTQVVPDLFQLSLSHVELSNMGGIPILGVRNIGINRVGRITKRLLDLTLLAILAIPTLILSAVIAVAIKLDSPGPILFVQERVGQGGKQFKMFKFRSMVADADAQKASLMAYNDVDGPIFKIKEDPRLTRIGRIIRRLSLDELPQFYNILIGNMSFVGPRPPLESEVIQYQAWHQRRMEVKGGLTGLWQVSGRSDLTFDEQCLLDIYYIENWSLAFDLRIILQTIPYTLFGRGAY